MAPSFLLSRSTSWRQTILIDACTVNIARIAMQEGLLRKQFNLIELVWMLRGLELAAPFHRSPFVLCDVR
ncbi:hypothetical protein CA13_17150 [Planctomycetes bacterium CA13]|uniref:Uncharacterized protein n=1 Tax=Novipirellula herctigrandis TaxID=2527986 RepID=A0A5C5YYX8_9BACT|nr:hypothetical protein CA13_17150 [Planctomycetes bacterium CA13]